MLGSVVRAIEAPKHINFHDLSEDLRACFWSFLVQKRFDSHNCSRVEVDSHISEDLVSFLERLLDLMFFRYIAANVVTVLRSQFLNNLASCLFIYIKEHYFAAVRHEASCGSQT